MSRIGKQPVSMPKHVTVTIKDNTVSVSGPKGQLQLDLPHQIKVEVKDQQIIVTRTGQDKQSKANHGSIRAHLQNMVTGVVTPFTKQLEIRGTGYKASVSGQELTIIAGFIHPVKLAIPDGITVEVKDEVNLTVAGPDITKVGQLASNIRKVRKPEPYKGKGIRYVNEFIKIKPGKAAKTQ